jgi:two-component system, cell cycle sensor histidine kinase and response regulator CckA
VHYLNAFKDPALICDHLGMIKGANSAFQRFARRNRLEMPRRGKDLSDYLQNAPGLSASGYLNHIGNMIQAVRETRRAGRAYIHTTGDGRTHRLLLIRVRQGAGYSLLLRILKTQSAFRMSMQGLMQDLPTPSAVFDLQSRTLQNNAKFSALFGREPDQAEIQFSDCTGLPEFESILHAVELSHKTRQEQKIMLQFQMFDRDRNIEMRCVPRSHAVGKSGQVIATFQDMSLLFQARGSRMALHSLLADVLDLMPGGFLAADRFGNILRLNTSASRIFTTTIEDVVGQPIDTFFPAANPLKVLAATSSTAAQKSAGQTEMQARRMNGTDFPALVSVFEMTLGGFPLQCVMITDLSEIRDAERALAESEQRLMLMQKHEALGHLAGNIAHDFNNLIAIVLGYVDILSEGSNLDAEAKQMLGEIRKSAERGGGLTKQILAYAKHQNLDTVPLDIHQLLSEHISIIQAALTSGVKLVCDFTNEKAIVQVDETQFMQIIMNLAVNARDAMPSGGTVTINTESLTVSEEFFANQNIETKEGRFLRLNFTDSGCGIAEEHLSSIFDPYFSTKPRDKGTGLGLSVVYGIVKQLDGFIFCHSKLGSGSTFEILLPLSGEEAASAGRAFGQNLPAPQNYAGAHILVVDDEIPLGNVIARQLRVAGFEVHQAASGREALDFIDSFSGQLDLILTDIMMPEMSGIEMIDEARLMQPGASVIFMSGYSRELLVSGRPTSNLTLLTKPFSNATLMAAIDSELATRNAQ